MKVELLTREDLNQLKKEIIQELSAIIQPGELNAEWLKSSEVRKLLKCSPGTLQSLRINGTIPFNKIGGTIYYNKRKLCDLLNRAL